MSRTALNVSGGVSFKEIGELTRKWSRSLNCLELLKDFCLANQSPTTLGLYLAAEARDIESIITHSVDPLNYHDSSVDFGRGSSLFRFDYQACRMLAKYPFKGVRNTREAAEQSWLNYEELCRSTNEAIKNWSHHPIGGGLDEILHLAVRLCADCLGDFSLEEWVDSCRFGPGITSDSKDRLVYDKLIGPMGVTPSAKPLLDCIIQSSPPWLRARDGRLSQIEVSGRQAFVPKNAKTDRSIETQPSGCVFLQAGIGKMIRKRLRNFGIDLNDQSRNQYLARLGSRTGHLATLDLEGASDSLAYHLVLHMIPFEWFHAMDICRTGSVIRPDGSVHTLEKFSSMGNGYTFELESLIFWALSEAACRVLGYSKCVSVFGDDIICPTVCYPRVIEVLRVCGFRVNTQKSYSHGLFRESCGCDCFDGVDIRPFYIREEVSDVQSHVRLANRIWRHASRHHGNVYLDARYRDCWIRVVSRIPSSLRRSLAGPAVESDHWLIQPEDFVLSNRFVRRVRIPGTGRLVWLCPGILELPIRRRKEEVHEEAVFAALLLKLHARSDVDNGNPYSKNPLSHLSSGGEVQVLNHRVRTTVKLRRVPTEWAAYPSSWI
ncbi:MAG: RNA replicase beta chain [Sanya fiers-like virus 33]|nr:MAG: RNA replicase beta chain [Sanya fiers-like virus 33]